jgi:heme a synthase
VATFILLCSGGIVTSKGVGMSVPDWPTTYGYNMFLFPISGWVGGIFYEHSHRLIASGVGLMTMILAASMLNCEPRRWVKTLGVVAFLAVCIQGLLGGMRVSLYKDELGIFHGMLAQSFFCLLGIITIATSPRFIRGGWDVFLRLSFYNLA